MKRLIFFPLLILCNAAVANAEIYTWTDDQGVVIFTDNPDHAPSRFSGITKSDGIIYIHTIATHKNPGRAGKTRLQAIIPKNRINSTFPRVKQKQLSLDQQSEIRGHLGGDQTDPAPPSMKQPKPLPIRNQPKAVPSGMKQPIPADIGEQPKATPSGMKQPEPEPIGDQPTPTPSGMVQPVPKL